MDKKLLLAATAAMISLSAVSAHAVSPTVPTTAQSERYSQRFTKDNVQSQITDKIVVQDQRQQADLGNAAEIKFVLKSVNVSGNTVFDDEALASIYKGQVGKTVTLQDVYVIRDQITKKYRDSGYIISRAIIPQQKFDKGAANVQIKVIEGYVNNVSVQGSSKGDQDIINNYVGKIKQAGPLNSKNLERYLLLLNDLPGTHATAVLRPAATGLGGSDVIISLDHDMVDGLASVDNSGSKFIGPVLGTVEANLNSALGMSEKITARVISDSEYDELKFGQLAYQQPIGYEGTKVKFSYGKTRTQPGSTLEPLKIVGDTNIAEAIVTHPFIRSRKENISGRVGFAYKNTDTSSLGLRIYDDTVSVATLGGTFDYADSFNGVNLLDLSVNQGIDIIGATDSHDLKSRANGDATFTRYNFEASRTQKITDKLSLLVASAGQYANEGLLASEEFGIGGREYGRGYDFSEITGDSGIAGKLELQYGIDTSYKYFSGLQLYGFYDAGKIWQKERFVAGEPASAGLTSTGIGVRFNVTNKLSGYVEGAKPLSRKIAAEGDKDVRLNLGLSLVF
jgi:hemolysin activation/secretion protein